MAIPKLVHQTWETLDLIPEHNCCVKSLKKNHPTWEWRFWDDESREKFVKAEFGFYYDTWKSFDKKIKRLDTIRYMWLYNYGGMYADVDVEFYSPIDPLMASAHADVLLLGGENAYDYSNCLMLSLPGHELWLRMLEFSKDNKNRFVTQCSGPVALGTVVKWYMKTTKNHKIHVFDYNILHWGGYKQGSACLDKIVYEGKLGAHHNSTPEEFHWLNSNN